MFHGFFCQKTTYLIDYWGVGILAILSKTFFVKESHFSIDFERGRFGSIWGNLGLHILK
jgi:hypothetical protein